MEGFLNRAHRSVVVSTARLNTRHALLITYSWIPLIHCALLFPTVLQCSPVYAEKERIGKFSSDDYQEFVQDAVRILAKGDERSLRKLLSPSMISRSEAELGKAKVDLMIRQQFLGFFEDFHHLSANVHSTKTFDAAKRPGLAIFRSFLNEEGEEKPFVMYVIEENDELVLGNVLINKTLRDVSNLAQSRKLPAP